MDRTHVERAVLSVSSPGTQICPGDDALARKITRQANDDVAKMCSEHPSRLSFFASLPLPDVEGSLDEIDYALDKLGAVGFTTMTNIYGTYLGDARFDAVFAKLNERKAILFIHPTQCHIHGHTDRKRPFEEYPAPMLEFPFDTVRCVTHLLLTGTAARNPDVKFLISHCGGALPPLLERFSNFSLRIQKGANPVTSEQAKQIFARQFYFDLAGFPFPDQIHGSLRLIDTSRLLYGSDIPYTPPDSVAFLGGVLDAEMPKHFDESTIRDIYAGNAQKLLDQAEKDIVATRK